jgi:hypothetical protein
MACSNDIYSIVPSIYALYIRDTNSYDIVGSLLGYLYFNLYGTGWTVSVYQFSRGFDVGSRSVSG